MTDDSVARNRSSRRALGRGLDALLTPATQHGLRDIDVEQIDPNPNQPRHRFDRAALDELAASIREHGIVQPLVVTAAEGGRYRLIVGERRWQAARIAGLTRVPAIIKEASDRDTLELALIENVQREDLNALEEAVAYQRLIEDFGLTQLQVGERVGKSRVTITNTLRLLALPETLKRAVSEGRIAEGHARALLSLPDLHAQLTVLDRIEQGGWTVRQTEEHVRRLLQAPAERTVSVRSPDLDAVERDLRNALGSPVTLRHGKRGGRIIIEYASDEEFQGLYARLIGQD